MNYLVKVPVVDLRREPIENTFSEAIDYKQESQLLFGEHVVAIKKQGDWVYINASEQQKCLPDGSWSGYPGWVQTKFLRPVEKPPQYNLIVKSNWAHIDSLIPLDVSIGTRLQGIEEFPDHWIVQLVEGEKGKVSKKDVRDLSAKPIQIPQSILESGRNMIGFPYYWGGRSAYRSDWNHLKTSIDCSGFVNLLYRIHDIDLPRDAHDQFLRSKPCEAADLLPGDLVFMASLKKPERISHVMIYSGEGRLLEATAASNNVREIPSVDRFSCPLTNIKSGASINDSIVHFGKVMAPFSTQFQ